MSRRREPAGRESPSESAGRDDLLERRIREDPFERQVWHLLVGTRGGTNRARVLRAVAARPRNANRVAEALDLDYSTVRHHLDVLRENGLVERSGDEYGAVYRPTDRLEYRWDLAEAVIERVTDD